MPVFTNCIVPDGGYLTADGYLRVLTKPRKEGGKLKMLHRLEWEKVHGPIPEGQEVDHKCKNRKCQNVNHLQILNRSEHKTKDNAQRYLLRVLDVLKYLSENPTEPQSKVAKKFGITQSAVSNIISRYPEVVDNSK